VVPNPVVLGSALPLTGILAPLGQAQQQGVQEALARVNAAGGVDVGGEQRQVEVVVRDTRSLPEVAGQAALILVRGRFDVAALLGPCAPPAAVVRAAESRDVPLVSGCEPLPPLGPTPLQHTWQVAPDEGDRASAVLGAMTSARSDRVALLLSNDWSEAVYADAARQAGLQLTGSYRPNGRSWQAAVSAARADGAELVVAVTQAPEGIDLWRELRDQQWHPELAYSNEAGLSSAWWRAVGRHGEGVLTDVVHPSALDGDGPAAVDRGVTAVSDELTRVLLDAVDGSPVSAREAINTSMAGAGGIVAGTPVAFVGSPRSDTPYALARWQDGALVPWPRVP
jgi:branched-chain amino acid transport system substrate-binding protein